MNDKYIWLKCFAICVVFSLIVIFAQWLLGGGSGFGTALFLVGTYAMCYGLSNYNSK